MRKVLVLLFLASALLAKSYSIIATTTKKRSPYQERRFLERFGDREAHIEYDGRFYVYKILGFGTNKEAKAYLKERVRPFYPDAFTINETFTNKVIVRSRGSVGSAKAPSSPCAAIGPRRTKIDRYYWEEIEGSEFENIPVQVRQEVTPLDAPPCDTPQKKDGCRQQRLRFFTDLYASYLLPQALGDRDAKDSITAKLGLIYECYFGDLWKFYTDDRLVYHNTDGDSDLFLEIYELYLQNFYSDDTSFLFGRKKIKDKRSWWYDNPLDLVGFRTRWDLFGLEGYLGTRIGDEVINDDADARARLDGTRFALLHGVYEYRYNRFLEGFALYERSYPDTPTRYKRRAAWIGGRYRAIYESPASIDEAWLDLGFVRGKEELGENWFSGVGLDLGVRHAPLDRPYGFIAQFAYGQGGDDHYTQPWIAYRRSNFYDRNLSIRYYGELLDPDLRNIYIAALRGFYHKGRSTYMLSGYKYWQEVPRVEYFRANSFYPTSGEDADIGAEIDFHYQYRIDRYYFKLVLAYFMGGGAYDYLDEPDAFKIYFGLRYYWR